MANESGAGPLSTLITLTRQLSGIIKEENNLLETRRPHETVQLQDAKNRLNSAYERELAALQEKGGIAAITDADMLHRFKQETRSFRDILDKHKRILVRLRTVTESMVKAIADEVSHQNNPVRNYGNNASLAPTPNRQPTSLALNQTV